MSNQRSALNRTHHLEIRKPLPNQSLRGGDFDLVDHGIENEQLIVAHGSDIISWEESDGQPLVHQIEQLDYEYHCTEVQTCHGQLDPKSDPKTHDD